MSVDVCLIRSHLKSKLYHVITKYTINLHTMFAESTGGIDLVSQGGGAKMDKIVYKCGVKISIRNIVKEYGLCL